MFDKTINVKTIDLSGVNLPSDDEATCDLIYSALSTTYGFPIYMENFKVNGVKHDSVLVNPIILENQTIINFNDCHLIVTPTDISVGMGVYGASLESIVDKYGNPRFVEGGITLTENTRVTKNYGKWSLCGTHFMCVLYLSIASGSAENVSNNFIVLDDVPEWIKNKIIPLSGHDIDVKLFTGYSTTNLSSSVFTRSFFFTKNIDNNLRILPSAFTIPETSANSVMRIQFDIIIDDDYED